MEHFIATAIVFASLATFCTLCLVINKNVGHSVFFRKITYYSMWVAFAGLPVYAVLMAVQLGDV